MKITFLLSLIFTSFYAHADETIVPLDMELGYWETTTEIGENDMIKQMLANMPEAQRAQMRAMIESEMKPPVVKQCITKDSLKDMDKQLREAISGQQQCKFKVTKSTNKVFMAELDCAGNITNLDTKVITSKRHESNVVSEVAKMGATNMRTIAEWKSVTCPAGL